MSRKARIETEIKEYVGSQSGRSFRVWDFKVGRRAGRGFLVRGTVYAFAGFETERVFEFQEDLEKTVGVPVEVQLTIVPATLTTVGGEPEAEPSSESEVVRSNSE